MEGPRIDQNPRLAPAAAGLILTILVWNDQKVFIKNREELTCQNVTMQVLVYLTYGHKID